MNSYNFINFHILISHSPSNLNRDDMNMQKTAIFGGTRRVRISSQSIKRAIRHSDYYKQNMSEPSDRTRELGVLKAGYTEKLKDKFSSSLIEEVILAISFEKKDLIAIKKLKKDIEDNKNVEKNTEKLNKYNRSGAVSVWSLSEVEKYCEIYKKLQEENPEEKDFIKVWEKTVNKKNLINNKTQLAIFRETLQNSKDIALSGRMATSGIMTNVDAALAVAHAITTHTVDGDIDWFTAVDDLNESIGETGSAHLDTTEFSSGVFYRYASLNIRQLQENLGDIDRTQALEIAGHVLHMLATVIPSAKQNSFAAFNLADFAFVSFSDQPISLANAFESPVKAKGEGFLLPSIKAITDYHESVFQAFNLEDNPQACYSTRSCDLKNVDSKGKNFSALKDWVVNNGA